MRNIRVIGWNTFLELVRNRILYTILLFAILIILGVESFSHFQKEMQAKLVKDISLTAIAYFSVFLALFLTMDQVSNEIERKTIYFVLTRPVHRLQFLVGKFLGVNAILILNLLFTGGTLVISLSGSRQAMDWNLLSSLILIFCQNLMISGLVLFFSTFLSNVLASTFSLFIYFFGTISGTLLHGLQESESHVLGMVVQTLQFLLPNFNLFDLHELVVSSTVTSVSLRYTLILVLYAILYTANLLLIGHLIFRRRDL